ncbi:MAG: NADH:flavin oxidoreductase [Anaerolineae bacterium]|nr:NADH:flavin oxidoreductase [Anaerolineae bacterium]
MTRSHYILFSAGHIGSLTLKNRLVRSATWDPCILQERQMTAEVVDTYRELAIGGVGLIITGGFPVASEGMPFTDEPGTALRLYDDLRVEGAHRLAQAVHQAAPDCKVVAQLETGHVGKAPSAIPSPFGDEPQAPLTAGEIRDIVASFVQAIVAAQADGFDGVQLHAAHGGFLSRFLSPYSNRRTDEYGGSAHNRARIVREIVWGAREKVGELPILIKMNGTDYMEGGIDLSNLPELAKEIEDAGIDAVEVSGGMWDCLARSEAALGFRPGPSPEAHTHIAHSAQQSYFLPYAEALDLGIPIILVGGNRDVERLEAIVRGGKVDFIALCRPLISEPHLPRRWMEGRGKSGTDCISCNACLYDMFVHPGRETPGLVHCVFKADKEKYRAAQEWVATWVERNVAR